MTDDARVKYVATAMRRALTENWSGWESAAQAVLKAVDTPPRPWPSDESCRAVQKVIAKRFGWPDYRGRDAREIAEAAIRADPIFQAACEVNVDDRASLARLGDALADAGVL